MNQIIIPTGEKPIINSRKKELIDTYIKQKEAYDTLVKTESLKKLFIFNKYVLNVEQNKQKLGLFHKQLCEFVTDDMTRKKLLLLPRAHLKSTLITIGYSTWRIIQNQNVRGLILNATWQMAVDFATEVKRHLRENETVHEYFGDLTQDAPEWSQDRFTIRRTDQNIKGPTLWAAGIDSNLVGSHPDFIIMDDVVSRENISNREQIEKVILRYKDALDLLEPGGQLIVIGCLTADSLVLMGNGKWRNINKVKVGDAVFSYKDKKLVKRKVEAMIPQGKSKVYRVKTIRHTIKATDRHPFLVIKENGVEWVRVRDLKRGDKVITISSIPSETSKRFYNNEFLRKDDFFLLGYLWGDGWLLQDKSRGIRGFCIAKGVNDKFIPNLKKWVNNYKEKKEGYYRIENKKIGEWLFKNGFRGGAKTKRIPEWIFTTRTCYKKAFIDGILAADGSKIRGEGQRIELANKELVEDLYWLSLTCGYRPTTIFHRQRLIQAPNSKEESLHDFYSLGLTLNYRQAYGENQYTWRWDRIESVEEDGEEEVFDLTIEDTANFIANGYVVHNTRWADGDLYDWIMDKSSTTFRNFDIMVKRAYTGDLLKGENFEALWPEKFNRLELLSRQREKGWYEFSSQYLNECVPAEDADFKKEWFQHYDIQEMRGKEMRTIGCIDPAISLSKDADNTAMGIVGVDKFTNIFIKDMVRKHLKPNEIIDWIFRLDEMWHPNMWLIETIAYQKALAYALREEMQKRRRYLPLTEVNYHDRTKDQRIRGLQPLYMNKKVWHPKGHIVTPYLEEELLRFPRGRRDDLIDMLSMTLDYLSPPRPKEKRFRHQYLY